MNKDGAPAPSFGAYDVLYDTEPNPDVLRVDALATLACTAAAADAFIAATAIGQQMDLDSSQLSRVELDYGASVIATGLFAVGTVMFAARFLEAAHRVGFANVVRLALGRAASDQ